MSNFFNYTEEHDNIIKDNIDKLSYQKMATMIGEKVTKNMVISRARTLKVKKDPAMKKIHKPDTSGTKATRRAPSKIDYKFEGKVDLEDVKPRQCRFSHDVGLPMMVCGDETYKDYSYCKSCCERMYTKFEQEKEEIKENDKKTVKA